MILRKDNLLLQSHSPQDALTGKNYHVSSTPYKHTLLTTSSNAVIESNNYKTLLNQN